MDKDEKLAQCEICLVSFSIGTLLQSSSDDFYCKGCFKRYFSKVAEAGDTQTEILELSGQKLLPHPEKYISNIVKEDKNMSFMSMSKRPLRCPKVDCNRYISVCTLESHFNYEHREVSIVPTHFDARCGCEFNPSDVRYSITQCIVLLKVSNAEKYLSAINIPIEEQRPIMVLMTTRIANTSDSSDDERTIEISPEKKQVDGSEEVFRKTDRILIWLGSNVPTGLTYSVAVSTMDNSVRQKYYGPMLTLNEAPEKVNKEGSCLILTYYHCVGMTENGNKPLMLDVVVHSPE